jgi:hypothetical protein
MLLMVCIGVGTRITGWLSTFIGLSGALVGGSCYIMSTLVAEIGLDLFQRMRTVIRLHSLELDLFSAGL